MNTSINHRPQNLNQSKKQNIILRGTNKQKNGDWTRSYPFPKPCLIDQEKPHLVNALNDTVQSNEQMDKEMGKLREFSKKGFHHLLIKKVDDWCIYKRSKNGFTHYEVVKILTATKDTFINGRLARKKGDKYFPPASKWGKYGFTCKDLDRALEKLNSIVKSYNRSSD